MMPPAGACAARRLPARTIRRFGEEGFLAPLPALPADEAGRVLAEIERIEAARGGRLPALLNAKPHLLLPFLWDLVHDARIVDPVADLLGPDLLCLGTSLIDKRPDGRRHVDWHQDATFWGLSEPVAVTAWVALTPSTPANGCVRVLPGTHRRALAHMDSGDDDNLLGARERLREPPDPSAAKDLPLAPGEMSLHDPLVVHGSAPNRSGGRRVGFAIRYVPARVIQAGGTATLVRGRDPGHMPLETAPASAFDPAAMARHADIVRRGARVIAAGKAAHLAAAAGGPT
jgi:hypothetical protein